MSDWHFKFLKVNLWLNILCVSEKQLIDGLWLLEVWSELAVREYYDTLKPQTSGCLIWYNHSFGELSDREIERGGGFYRYG